MEEDEATLGNSWALNTIFNGVDQNIFQLINTCVFAKMHGIFLLFLMKRLQKLRCLTTVDATQFESMNIKEDETIFEFNFQLCVIVNESFTLNAKISKEKLVRSLQKRFNMKVTTIKEVQDIKTLKVYMLFNSFRTFEMSFLVKGWRRSPKPFRHELHLSHKYCYDTSQEIKDMSHIP